MTRIEFSHSQGKVISMDDEVCLYEYFGKTSVTAPLSEASEAVGKIHDVQDQILQNGYFIEDLNDGFALYASTKDIARLSLGIHLCP